MPSRSRPCSRVPAVADPAEDVAIAVLKGLASEVPSVATWLGNLIAGEATPSALSLRVRDILPERSASREAAEQIAKDSST